MRVRIRRFGRLRLIGKSGHSQSVVVAGGKADLNYLGGAMPPTSFEEGGLSGRRLRQSESGATPFRWTVLGLRLGFLFAGSIRS